MSNIVPLQTTEPLRPRDYSAQQLALIQRTVAADCNNDEFNLFVEVSRRLGLDPFRRQIHAVVYSKNNPEKRKMSIITGIDGFRAIAARRGDYRPDEASPEIVYKEDLKDPATNPLGIEKAIYRAYKMDSAGAWHAIPGVAFWDEYAPVREIWERNPETNKKAPTGRFELDKGSTWGRMPRLMIAKCAEAQALRKGWPEDLSGVYSEEEMARVEVIDRTATEIIEDDKTQRVQAALNHAHSIPIQWEAGAPITYEPDGQFGSKAIDFIRAVESPTQLQTWADINRHALREYWTRDKSGALEVKKEMEKRMTDLDPPASDGDAA